MIHTRTRWVVRMHSGATHVIEPLSWNDPAESVSPFAGPITKALNTTGAQYVSAYVFDRLDAIIAGDPVLLAVAHIETVTSRQVQIEAPEDAFS